MSWWVGWRKIWLVAGIVNVNLPADGHILMYVTQLIVLKIHTNDT